DARILVMGITFKENCPDIRNTRVTDIIHELSSFGMHIHVYDPMASKEEVKRTYHIDLTDHLEAHYDGIVLAVGHKAFLGIDWETIKKNGTVIYDVKAFLDKAYVDARL